MEFLNFHCFTCGAGWVLPGEIIKMALESVKVCTGYQVDGDHNQTKENNIYVVSKII